MARRSKNTPMKRIKRAFDRDALRRICTMHENDFVEAYDMSYVPVDQRAPNDFYAYKDNGSNILAVAHLDTVGLHEQRACNFLNTAGGEVVYSRALDDRLGAFIILDLLPNLGIQYDILLTTGEEEGRSTAAFFETSKDYDWMIEFDRGGTDVVTYDYEDDYTSQLVRASGARMGQGIFSDICYLDHLGIKGFNWGVGYQDYHGPRAHAYLDDTMEMVAKYLKFHAANQDKFLPHVPQPKDEAVSGWGWLKDYRGGDSFEWDTEADEFATSGDLVVDNPTLEQLEEAFAVDYPWAN